MSQGEAMERPGHVERAAAWVYEGLWGVITGWLRTPREGPTLPAHDDERVDVFHPSRDWLRMLRMWFWIGLAIVDGLLLILWIVIATQESWVALVLSPLFLIVMIVPDIVVYIAIHLRYDVTWYVLTDRSVRTRRGVFVIREMTFTFENVQNVRVEQGPIERIFGVARVLIDTAGGGSGGESAGMRSHRGVIEGVSNAHEIRDRIMDRVRQSRGAGLGDERVVTPGARSGGPAWTDEHLAVLREIAGEVRGG